MDDAEVKAIAAAVAEQLHGSSIPSSLPADVGQAIRESASGGSIYWLNNIPLRGACGLSTHWTLAPDGGLHLELRRWDGSSFWRGTFQPVKEAVSGA